RVGVVLVLAFVMGVINAFDMPGRQSLLSELVEPELLPNAIALNSAIFNAARLLGPAFGGLVLGAFGEAMCFWLNAISYIAVIVALWWVSLPLAGPRPVEGSALARLREGVGYAWRTSSL